MSRGFQLSALSACAHIFAVSAPTVQAPARSPLCGRRGAHGHRTTPYPGDSGVSSMNIAMVSVHASPLNTGVPPFESHSVHVAELARELGRQGHHVTVYTHRAGL